MANLTISVDGQVLKRARIRALDEGDSVNRFLARQLTRYSQGAHEFGEEDEIADRFISLSEELSGTSHGRGWTREELWEDAVR